MRTGLHRAALLATGILLFQLGVATAQGTVTGFTSKVLAPSVRVKAGQAAALTTRVGSKNKVANYIVSVAVFNAKGTKLGQRDWTAQNFTAGKQNTYKWSWKAAGKGTYTVKVGVFGPNWKPLRHWNNRAFVLTVA